MKLSPLILTLIWIIAVYIVGSLAQTFIVPWIGEVYGLTSTTLWIAIGTILLVILVFIAKK